MVAVAITAATLARSNSAFVATTSNTADSWSTGTWTNYRSIALGDKHTCAVKADRHAWCWGQNTNGQLGDNTGTDRSTPVEVVDVGGTGALTSLSAISAGTTYTCALRVAGTVACWGRNDKGQLGDGTTTDRDAPVNVVGLAGSGVLSGVVAISSGGTHACAIRTDGTVWCWGRNVDGQLGDNSVSDRSTPEPVLDSTGSASLTNVVTVSAGGSHTCAVRSDTNLWCWGRNDKGQVGDNTTTDRHLPTQVLGVGATGTLTNVTSATTGGLHTCALKSDTGVVCWGKNTNGQLGDNTLTDRHSPVQVAGSGGSGTISTVVAVDSSGKESTCALRLDRSTWCWGNNPRGQLGNGTLTDSKFPVQVVGSSGTGQLTAIELIAVGGEHACAISSADAVWCWGGNTRGQLGDGTTTNRSWPTAVLI